MKICRKTAKYLFWKNVTLKQRVGMDGVFLVLAGLLLRILLRLTILVKSLRALGKRVHSPCFPKTILILKMFWWQASETVCLKHILPAISVITNHYQDHIEYILQSGLLYWCNIWYHYTTQMTFSDNFIQVWHMASQIIMWLCRYLTLEININLAL